MADKIAEDIRELRKIQSPPNPPRVPGPDGAYMVPADHLERWYSKTGGAKAAMGSAQLSQAERLLRGEESPFPTWNASRAYDKVPVIPSSMPGSARGLYRTNPQENDSPSVEISNKLSDSSPSAMMVIEHELGHHMFDAGQPGGQSVLGAKTGTPPTVLSRNDLPESAAFNHSRYLRRPEEIDTRIAGINRRYAYNTGELVDTPEKSEKALKWFVENWQPAEGVDDMSISDRDAASEYLDLPEKAKKQVMQRMTEVSKNNPTDELINRLM